MEFRIEDFGMCNPQRELEMKDFLSFGISEIISPLLDENEIVMVCEGCGNMLVTDSSKAQGIGGRVSGLAKTSPIPEIIERIGKENILDWENASINQLAGTQFAIDKGHKNIAVTVTNGVDSANLKELEKK
jgi:putative methanogenesis marker protein 8